MHPNDSLCIPMIKIKAYQLKYDPNENIANESVATLRDEIYLAICTLNAQ